ncbi:glycosyltransferase [Catellatospora coxensis]
MADRWPGFRGRPYFNAGAMWCDTEVLARLHTDVARIMRHDGRHIHYNDQDALNLWGLRHDSVQPLPPEFNTFEVDRFAELGDWVHPILAATKVPSSPVVLHFVGAEKPWLDNCPSTPAVGLYRRYLRHARRLAVGDPSCGSRERGAYGTTAAAAAEPARPSRRWTTEPRPRRMPQTRPAGLATRTTRW